MKIILIDTREQNAAYIKRRFDSVDIESEITGLPTETGSDYLISNTYGSVAIQRKVVVSEMISELDEIMYQIAPRMINFSENTVMLLEENFGISKSGYLFNRQDNRETEMLATSYYGYLETIRKMGIEVITTRDLNSSIWWMISTHGYLGKQHYPKHIKYHGIKEQAIGMMTVVPGIGEARAAKALSKSSIRGMAGMKHVEGLTLKQTEKLHSVLRFKSC